MRDKYAEGPSIAQSLPGEWMEPGRHNTSAEEVFGFKSEVAADAALGNKNNDIKKRLATSKIYFNITEYAPDRTAFVLIVNSNGFST
jgi:hypothetical protein